MAKDKTPSDVSKLIKESNVKLIDFKFTDLLGTWQHFTTTLTEYNEEIFTDGLGFDGSSIRGWRVINASDMVQDAYVNHIPVLTGGVGKDELREFYSKRFIPQMPPDTEMTPVSRTIGKDQLVDEMIFKFTHTIRMDWMLPGVAPTGKRVEVPLVAIVRFKEGKLAHEHVYWDQASVLVQLGLIDRSNLPVMGIESARKVLDPTVPANELIKRAEPS